MAQGRKFEVAFMDEVQEFLDTLDDAPRDKIVYNVHKVVGGVIDNDLFKKLDGSDDIYMESATKRNLSCRGITKEVLRIKIENSYGNETSHLR